jgi:hypothetical protein
MPRFSQMVPTLGRPTEVAELLAVGVPDNDRAANGNRRLQNAHDRWILQC